MEKWATNKPGIDAFPAKPIRFALYLAFLTGAKCILARKTTKKEPITPEILHRMYAKLVTPSAELPIICTMTICLLGYAGFFRFSALAFLRESIVVFYDEHAEISSSQARLTSIEMVLGCPLHVPTLTFAR